MATERLISRHSLDNGLILEMWDRSRPVAGDRCQVVLETRIGIPITTDTLPTDLRGRRSEIVQALGPQIVFSQARERNFISASVAPALLKEMEAQILDVTRKYFSHPDFPGRYIRKKFAEYLAKPRRSGR